MTGVSAYSDETALVGLIVPPDQTFPNQPDLLVDIEFDGEPHATFYDTMRNDGPSWYGRMGEPSGTAIVDESAFAHNGTYSGSPTLGVAGWLPAVSNDLDTAATFAGTAKGVITDSAALSPTLWMSMEFAIKLAAWPGGTRDVISKLLSYRAQITSAGKVVGQFLNGGSSVSWTSTGTLSTGSYHWVSIVYNAAAVLIYIDGVLDSTSGDYFDGIADNANSVNLMYDGTNYLAGTLDEVAIYPFGLTAQQVAAHYRSRKVNTTPSWTDVSDDVISVATQRGRQFELDVIQTGTATVTLDNVSRDYDPANSGSAYYPDVIPEKKLRIRAACNEVTNPDFENNIDGWTAYQGATLTQDDAHFETGNASLKVVTPGTHSDCEGATSNLVTVDAGDEVRSKVWVYAPLGIDLQVSIEEYDVSEVYLRETDSLIVGTGAWQEVDITAVTGASTVYCTVGVFTRYGESIATTFYVDTAVLKRVYPIFQGFIERWPQSWEGMGYGYTTITASDGFEGLGQSAITGGVDSALSGTTINTLLNAADWPRAARNIDPGQATMAFLVLSAAGALSTIQGVAASEINGLFLMDRSGNATFQDRLHRQSPVSYATFADDTAGLEYAELDPSLDKDRIVNDWLITPDSSVSTTAQEATDEDSIRQFRRRSQTLNTNLSLGADALSAAQYLILRTADPQLRFDSMAIEPLNDITLWQQALGREISDSVTIQRTPAVETPGDTISQQVFVESTAWDIKVDTPWRCVWQLSPVVSVTHWTLNDADLGKLDNGNVLSF